MYQKELPVTLIHTQVWELDSRARKSCKTVIRKAGSAHGGNEGCPSLTVFALGHVIDPPYGFHFSSIQSTN